MTGFSPLRSGTSARAVHLNEVYDWLERGISTLWAAALKLGAIPALTGLIRLPNAAVIAWRDAANTFDASGIWFDAQGYLNLYGSTQLVGPDVVGKDLDLTDTTSGERWRLRHATHANLNALQVGYDAGAGTWPGFPALSLGTTGAATFSGPLNVSIPLDAGAVDVGGDGDGQSYAFVLLRQRAAAGSWGMYHLQRLTDPHYLDFYYTPDNVLWYKALSLRPDGSAHADNLYAGTMRTHRHPYATNRHIESGTVEVTLPTLTAAVTFTDAFSAAPVVVVSGMGHTGNVMLNSSPSGSGFTMQSTAAGWCSWIADGPD